MRTSFLTLAAAALIFASSHAAHADSFGTVTGGVGGAVVGGAVGGPVGAVVGGLAGSAIGNRMTGHPYYWHHRHYGYYYRHHPYYRYGY